MILYYIFQKIGRDIKIYFTFPLVVVNLLVNPLMSPFMLYGPNPRRLSPVVFWEPEDLTFGDNRSPAPASRVLIQTNEERGVFSDVDTPTPTSPQASQSKKQETQINCRMLSMKWFINDLHLRSCSKFVSII